MRIGKLENEVLEKLVLNKFKATRKETLSAPRVGMDCALLRLFDDPEQLAAFSTDPITAATSRIGYLTVHINCNDAATVGAEPIALLVTLLAPPETTEAELGAIADDLAAAARAANVDIVGGHTEITSAVTRVVSSATVIARPVEGRTVSPDGIMPGDDIVMTKHAGLEGCAILAGEHAHDGLLTDAESAEALGFLEQLSVVPESMVAAKNGAHAMHDITEGGVFGALWELAYAAGVGVTVDLAAIPVRDVTRKLCAHFGLDEYRLLSSGSMLIACENGAHMVAGLKNAGITAAIIGKADRDSGVVSLSGEPIAAPGADELYKVL